MLVPRFLIGLLLIATWCSFASAQSFVSRVLARDMGGAEDVNARDYDGDGDIDLAVSTWIPGGVHYYDRQQPDTLIGTELYVAGGAGRKLTTGDFDGDGDYDIAFASFNEDRLVVLHNGPGATPADRFSLEFLEEGAYHPYAVLAGDFSGDGGDDLVLSEILDGHERVKLYRQVSGELVDIWESGLPSAEDPLGLEIADIDGDGVMEILVAVASQNGGMFVMRRTQTGTYSITQEIDDTYLVALRAADLDADGAIDIVACDYSSDIMRRYERTETGWTTTNLPGAIVNPREVVIEDFDADGMLDFAATGEGYNGFGGNVAWWRQTANGSFVYQNLITEEGFSGLEGVDYDRDGDMDLLAANWQSEEVYLFENRMGTPTRIIGHVTTERGGEPAEGVLVTALQTGVSSRTDASGRYELGMIEGTFTLRFEHSCWQMMEITGVQTIEDDTTTVDAQLHRPEIELPVTSLNLFVQNDLQSTYDMVINNSGDAPLNISTGVAGIQPVNGWVSVTPPSLEIAAGSSGTVQVTLAPDTSNDNQFEYLGSLTLHTNSCPDTLVDIALVIIVLDAPEVETGIVPTLTAIAPAYPNPFNPIANIPVEIASGGRYSLRVYDILGRAVETLYDSNLNPGRFVFQWHGDHSASGRYIAVLQSAEGARWETSLTLIK